MFNKFFYECKAKGLDISTTEWLTLQKALDMGLAHSSLTEFYYLARSILVKTETDFDRFDMAFMEYFKGVEKDTEVGAEMMRWLNKADEMKELLDQEEKKWVSVEQEQVQIDTEEVQAKFRERLRDQDSEHNGGNFWIGTMGKTAFGNSGSLANGIRVGGSPGNQSAFEVIGARKYRDFRHDKVIDNRQFMAAFRKLRQYSTRLDVPKTELDIDGTIDKTCGNGGLLEIVMEKPRKNAVKLLLLMDSGGTMIPYTNLMAKLWQSVNKSNHFKDVKCYYFHNCIYAKVYNTPECENGDWVDTEWLFRNLDSDYKVMIIGDAAMAPEELYSDNGNYRGPNGGFSGWDWLHQLKKHYKKIVWMNPKMAPAPAPWREAETAIQTILPMYFLSVEGLDKAMVELMKKEK